MARPQMRIDELSPERLRKLSPYEIQQRKEQEKKMQKHQSNIKKAKKVTNVTIKKYLKSIINEDVELSDIEIIVPLINELHFIEEVISSIKDDIVENGVIDAMRTKNPLLSEYGSLLKQKALIIDKITKALNNKVQSQESTPEASISDLLNQFEIMEV
ncbi:hypothetical protein [Clostridium sp.]|uniref:hypothetical protein n=1 Tax=Clostridium sp. TaxID=1506 RepID=UPI00260A7C3F|nr:hypothetical protein [Clostridium sp.]